MPNSSKKNHDSSKPKLDYSTVLPILAILGMAAYSLLFLSQKLVDRSDFQGATVSIPRWQEMLVLLTLPDVIFQSWVAGDTMPTGIIDRLLPFTAAALWLGASYLLGRRGLSRLGLWDQCNRGEQIGLSLACGLQFLSLCTLVLGLAQCLSSRWPLLATILFFLFLVSIPLSKKRFRARHRIKSDEEIVEGLDDPPTAEASLHESWKQEKVEEHWTTPKRRFVGILAMLAVAFGLLYLFGAVLPPIEFDVREYHLQSPKEFFQTGGIRFHPHNIYANMPLGTEMHSLAWMVLIGGQDGWFDGALIGKIVTASFAWIGALLIGGSVTRYFGRLSGWLSACIYLATPGIAEVSRLGLIDAVLGCYTMAVVVVLAIVLDERRPSIRWGALSLLIGWLLGASISCKYTAVPFLLIPVVLLWPFVLWIKNDRSTRLLLRYTTTLILAIGLSGGLWYVKNLIFTGNPVYPLLANVLGGETMDTDKIAQWNTAHRVPRVQSATSPTAPADYTWSSMVEGLRKTLLIAPGLGLLAVPLAILGLVATRQPTRWLMFLMIVWMLIVWWGATHRLERFLLPTIPLWCWLAGAGAHWLGRQYRGIPLYFFTGIGLMYGMLIIAGSRDFNDIRIGVTLDALRNDTMLTQHDSTESGGDPSQSTTRVPLHQRWLNEHMDLEGRVLLIGDAAVFDLRIPILYSTCFDRSEFETATKGLSVEQQRENLKRLGITYVMIHWAEIARYRSPGNYGFSPYVQRELLQEMVAEGLLERVDWPVLSEVAELYRVN